MLNGATPIELAGCCSFIERTYPAPYDFLARAGDPDAALELVPRDWDYVVDDERSRDPRQLEFEGLRRYYQAAHRHFRARLLHGTAGSEPPPYRPHGQLRLNLPEASRRRAAEKIGNRGTTIALMPAGSSEPSRYPSQASWVRIVEALASAFPDVTFCLLGKVGRDDRTSTSLVSEDFGRIAEAAPRVVSAVDEPLLDQLAQVEACDLFVSPHTGFGLAVLSVGTPWLRLSGGPWHEWFFNDVPFHSVIPDTSRYPCYTQIDAPPRLVDDEGSPRTPSMTRQRVEEDLPELVDAARALLGGRVDYKDALRRYFPRLLAAYGGNRARVFAFDGIDRAFI